ncbi:MAG: HAD hydrolase-like protein, partial [Spirochaetales bacterium]|nr:HAD hydrolase-like protein [Spirochaetales bacterium]
RHSRPLTPVQTGQRPLLRRLATVRAVLFDVYGTLFISASGDIGTGRAEARGRIMGQALEAVGIPADRHDAETAAACLVKTITERHRRLREEGRSCPEVEIGDVFREVLEDLQRRGLPVAGPGRELCENLAVEYECRSNPIWPMPGVVETICGLKERRMTLGIVSNAQFVTPLLFPALLDESLESLGFDPQLCVWSYRYLESKPSPNLFRRALEGLDQRGIAAKEVLYVGNDRLNDIWPAAASGMKTALFAGDLRSFRPREGDPRLRNVREQIVLTKLPQLLEVLAAA